jgi:hypothetical protein
MVPRTSILLCQCFIAGVPCHHRVYFMFNPSHLFSLDKKIDHIYSSLLLSLFLALPYARKPRRRDPTTLTHGGGWGSVRAEEVYPPPWPRRRVWRTYTAPRCGACSGIVHATAKNMGSSGSTPCPYASSAMLTLAPCPSIVTLHVHWPSRISTSGCWCEPLRQCGRRESVLLEGDLKGSLHLAFGYHRCPRAACAAREACCATCRAVRAARHGSPPGVLAPPWRVVARPHGVHSICTRPQPQSSPHLWGHSGDA